MSDRVPSAEMPCDDLLWIAVRYLEGDLSAEESEAYEQRLSDDQQAAEALAAAVQLTAGVRACSGIPAVRPMVAASPSRRAVHRLLAAACAIGLVLLGWYAGDRTASREAPGSGDRMVNGEQTTDDGSRKTGDSSTDSMLAVWVALNASQPHESEEALIDPGPVVLVDGDVPDWMFAALMAPADAAGARDAAMPPGMESVMEESL